MTTGWNRGKFSVFSKRSRRILKELKMSVHAKKIRQFLLAGLGLCVMCTIFLVVSLNMGILEHPYQRRLAVIVPFRDRLEELLEFVPHMAKFLTDQGIRYRIMVINQGDSFRFNRGSLINIGYHVSKAQYDYLVMHDVDLLPLNPKLSYAYPEKENTIVHLAAPNLHPKYHYKTFVGGILMMRHSLFAKLDGLSNKYWGWGLEDDEFYVRMKEGEVTLKRPENIGTGINDTFKHTHDARKRPRDMMRIGDQKEESRKRDRLTGVHNVNFKILSQHQLIIDGFAADFFNVHVDCDVTLTPWCEKHKPKKNS